MRWNLRPRAGLVLPLLLLIAFACDEGAEAPEERSLQPAPLAVTPQRLDLPRIPFGGSAKGHFRLRNEADHAVTIARIGPTSCDCAILDLELPQRGETIRMDPLGTSVVLAAGEELVVNLEMDTSRYRQPVSFKTGSIPVIFEDYDYLTLEYFADIWVPFWAEPWSLELGHVTARARARGHVVVKANEEESFGLLLPDELDGWELRAERSEQDGRTTWRIDVIAPEEMPLGAFQKEFVLRTDLSGAPPVRFWATGVVEPDVVHSPKRLLLAGDQGRVSASVSVRALPADLILPPPAARVECQGDLALRLESETIEPGRLYRFTVHLPGDVPPLTESARLILDLVHDEIARIEVPITILPSRKASGGSGSSPE